ncbi:prohead core protein protease [Klebsiella phage vB_KpnM-VAC36]|nr:prohead core protein protease [Klebsiella phage vB_KpnM-VAC36]
MEAVIAKANTLSRNGTMYSPEALEKAIDYAKIRSDKNEMITRFNFAYDKAKAEGTITYRKI